MPDPFASPKRRIARARQHTENIKTGVGTFFQSRPYAQVAERNARGFEEHKIKLTRPIPDEITDLAYEVIEALRSALDQAVHPVAIACGVKRPDLIHFPMADNATDFENVLKGRVKDLPPDIVALFRSFQPYQGGNELIWALNRVRRQGTHRLIVPVGTVNGAVVGNFQQSSPLPLTVYTTPKWDSEKDEVIYAVTGPHSNLQYKFEIAFYIAFGQVEGALASEAVIETLEDMAAEVERLVLAIEAESRRLSIIN
jgi:hypothetical protein